MPFPTVSLTGTPETKPRGVIIEQIISAFFVLLLCMCTLLRGATIYWPFTMSLALYRTHLINLYDCPLEEVLLSTPF